MSTFQLQRKGDDERAGKCELSEQVGAFTCTQWDLIARFLSRSAG